MASKPQRLRGVRQRHWGSWVSEIRHPISKTRVWLGTYQTREEAARAYDAAAWIMCGPKAKTNYPYSPLTYSSAAILPPLLRKKLQRCCLESVKIMAQQSTNKSSSATTQGDQITSKGLMREEENASSSQDEEDYDAEGEESPPISPASQQSADLQQQEEENASSSQDEDEDDYDAEGEGEESPPISPSPSPPPPPPQQSTDLQQWEDLGLFLHQLTDHERVSRFLDELHDFNHLEWSLALPYDPQPIHHSSTCDDTCVSFVDDSLVDESLFAL